MLLMLKDIPLLKMNPDEYIFEVYRQDLLPYDLKDRFEHVISQDLQYAWKIVHNIRSVQDFLSSRVLPLSRKNAKKIYNLLGNNQHDKLRLAFLCKGISLLDDYWVKLCSDQILWQDVSIRENPLNEIFTQVALRGSSLSLQGSITTPETTTDGAYAKGWKRENGRLYLYKKGYESHIEVMVSKLLDQLEIPHVSYEHAEDDGDYCCKCPCVTTDTASIVDAGVMEAWCNRTQKSFIHYVLSIDAEHFYQMCIVDYLISNPDRHSRNWGFCYDTDTTKLKGLHPLFDHNNSFDPAYMSNPDADYIVLPGQTMRQAAKYAAKKINVTYKRPFTEQDFLTQRQYRSFMSRLNDLGIKQKDGSA